MSHLFPFLSLHALVGRQKNSTAPTELTLFGLEPHLSGTGGPGRRDDGGTAPCGRWRWPSACGSRGPCCAAASWADRYASFQYTSCTHFSGGLPPVPQRRSGTPARSSMLVRLKTQRILYWKNRPSSTVFCHFSFRFPPLSHMLWSEKFCPQTQGFSGENFFEKGGVFVAIKRIFWYNGMDNLNYRNE